MPKSQQQKEIRAVHIVTTCPKCGEAVEIYFTKKHLKHFLKQLKGKATEAIKTTPEGIKDVEKGGYF